MRSLEKGTRSATMRKREGVEPRNNPCCTGSRVSFPGNQNRSMRNGKCASGVPGSKSMAGIGTVYVGTWENCGVPFRSLREAEKAGRGYDAAVVGPPHSRGVGGAMPAEDGSPLEGDGVSVQREEIRL